MVLLLPWTLRNTAHFGGMVVVSTNTGLNTYIGSFPEIVFDSTDPRYALVLAEGEANGMNEAQLDRQFLRMGLDCWLADPPASLRRLGATLAGLWQTPFEDWVILMQPTVGLNTDATVLLPRVVHLVFVGLAAVAALACLWRRDASLFLLAVPAGITLGYLPAFAQQRFVLPALPMVALLAVMALAWLAGWCATLPRARGRLMARLVAASLALLLSAASVAMALQLSPQAILESPHPYPRDTHLTWTAKNPDAQAAGTQVYFQQLSLGAGDRIALTDADERVWQEFAGDSLPDGGWSVGVAGSVVVIHLQSGVDGGGVGFTIGGIRSAEPGAPLARLSEAAQLLARARRVDDRTIEVTIERSAGVWPAGHVGIDIYGANSPRPHLG